MSDWRVRVRTGGSVCGAGILVDRRHVVTCAHVVNQALGRHPEDRTVPQEPVEVDFPSVRHSTATARVVPDRWVGIGEDGHGDLAVLELAGSLPDGARPAPAWAQAGRGTAVHVYGHPRGHDHGIESQAVVGGPGGPDGTWVQLESERVTGYRITTGFSGAGVVETATGAVVGILVAEVTEPAAKVSWMLPTPAVVGLLPGLLTEVDTTAAPPAANTLPAALGDFVGRAEELELLRAATGRPDRALAIHALSGMAGVGKTALAVELAHDLAGRYPDGCLFIDLQAHTERAAPLEPEVALARLLASLGVVPDRPPSSVAEWAESWRAELARRRVLVVLDNAACAEQVGPLLPGSTRSLALITSRRRLVGLDGVTDLPLDVLPDGAARALFARVAGSERAAREPDAVARIVALCANLPLAVRLVAARLRSHPAWRVADMLRDISEEHLRLDTLRAGDGGTARAGRQDRSGPSGRSVRAAFAPSYRDLSQADRTLLRRLGLHPTAEFGAHVAAALAGTDLRRTRAALERLVNGSLLRETARDRYRLHDLMREYARERVRAEEPAAWRRAAVHRMLDHYLQCAVAAHESLLPFRAVHDAADHPTPAMPDVSTPESALGWFTGEHANLIGCLDTARDYGLHSHTWRIPRAMGHCLGLRADVGNAAAAFTAGRSAAETAGDRAGLAHMAAGLAEVEHMRGRHAAALSGLDEARRLYRSLGDRVATGDLANRIGRTLRLLGDLDAARARHEEALEAFVGLADRFGQAESHHYLGMVERMAGADEAALTHQEAALTLYRALPHDLGVARAQQAIGILLRLRGDYRGAVLHFDEAMQAYRRHGDRRGVGHVLNNTASALLLLGELDAAAERVGEAIEVFRAVGNRGGEADALVVSARVHRAMGEFGEARERLVRSLRMATDMSARSGQANALLELSRTLRADGDPAGARDHGERALAVYESVGSRRGRVVAHLEVARCLHALGDTDARTHCADALALCDEHGLHVEAAEAGRLLDEISEVNRISGPNEMDGSDLAREGGNAVGGVVHGVDRPGDHPSGGGGGGVQGA